MSIALYTVAYRCVHAWPHIHHCIPKIPLIVMSSVIYYKPSVRRNKTYKVLGVSRILGKRKRERERKRTLLNAPVNY